MKFVKSIVTRETITTDVIQCFLLFSAILFTFIPIRYILHGYSAEILGRYSDFTAISVYLSLIFCSILSLLTIYSWLTNHPSTLLIKAAATLLVISLLYIFVVPNELKTVSVYNLIKITCGLFVGYYVYKSKITHKYKDIILWTSVGLAAVNAIIALIQFGLQSSIGLNMIGESPLSIFGWEIAKSVAHGTPFVRGYGLFPHPNTLGGILVIISIFNLYLLNKTTQFLHHVILISTFCLILGGIFVSQSRSALLAMFLSYAIVGVSMLKKKNWRLIQSLIFISIWLIILFFLFLPWLSNRATLNDHSMKERGILADTTIKLIADNWLLGTGPGTNLIMLHGKLQSSMDYWLIQPVHNYFLINISDLGLFGLTGIILILFLFFRQIHNSIQGGVLDHSWSLSLSTICFAVFILFWFDHYFYTYWPAQLLLALIIGFVAQDIQQSKQSTKIEVKEK
jgi:hypothetical protein